jgi:phage protein D
MPLGDHAVKHLAVEVRGARLPDDVAALLVRGFVDDSLDQSDRFELRFSDDRGTVVEQAGLALGVDVRLSVLGPRGGLTELLVGEVTAVEIELLEAGMETVVRGLDRSHRVLLGTRVAAYQDMRASDIVRQVAQRAGLQSRVDVTDTVYAHLSQEGVSDWEFLRRLARISHRVLNVSGHTLEFLAARDAAGTPPRGRERRSATVLEKGANLPRYGRPSARPDRRPSSRGPQSETPLCVRAPP